jgi:hypothetical protein
MAKIRNDMIKLHKGADTCQAVAWLTCGFGSSCPVSNIYE